MKLGVSVKPPGTALSSVTEKERASPSSARALVAVTEAETAGVLSDAVSSLVIVPVAVSLAVTGCVVPETVRATVKVSSASTSSSSVVATLNACVSPAVPLKAMAGVLAV